MEIPKPRPGELLVEVTCCTLCGSDLHTYRGQRSAPLPTILGHEIVGRVMQAGELFPGGFRPGERVTWSLCSSCGDCFYCREGIPQKCVELFKYGHQALDQSPLSGGLASYCLIRPGTAVHRIPDSLSDEEACPANCATATVMAAIRSAGDIQGQNVLIFGAGMLGLTAVAAARYRGAKTVFVVDLSHERLERAEEFGADVTILAGNSKEPLADIIAQGTEGHGPDVVLEFSGVPAAVSDALRLCRIGGRIILVGTVFPTDPVLVEPEKLVRRMLTLQGVHNYTPNDLAAGLEFLASRQDSSDFASLVKHSFPLDEVDQAFRFAIENNPIRVAVRP